MNGLSPVHDKTSHPTQGDNEVCARSVPFAGAGNDAEQPEGTALFFTARRGVAGFLQLLCGEASFCGASREQTSDILVAYT